jgi:hypothetical protein
MALIINSFSAPEATFFNVCKFFSASVFDPESSGFAEYCNNFTRQGFRGKNFVWRKQYRSFYHIFQFPDIARPFVIPKNFKFLHQKNQSLFLIPCWPFL